MKKNLINYHNIEIPDHKLGNLIGKRVAGYQISSPQGGSERYQNLEILFIDGSTLTVSSQEVHEYIDIDVVLK